MKVRNEFTGCAVGLGVLGLVACSAYALDTINQSGGSGTTFTGNNIGQGSANLGREINYATIVNDANNLYITVALTPAANLETEGSFNYVMDITSGNPSAGGDTSANATTHGNAYGRAISIDSSFGGMTYWVGAYGAGGSGSVSSPFTSFGFNDYAWNGSACTQIENVTSGQSISSQPSTSANNQFTLTIPLSDLNLTVGSTFDFDIDSTGTSGNQTAYGSLVTGPVQGGTYYLNGTSMTGSGTYSSTYQFNETVLDQYTVTAVPEPATIALAGLAGLSLMAFRRQRQ
jgi:PEP-CTERM motif